MGCRKQLYKGWENSERAIRMKISEWSLVSRRPVLNWRSTEVKSLWIFKLVVEGEAAIRSWRWISGEHIKWNFLFLKCEYKQIPLKHSSCQIFSSSPAQRAKTASNARFTCLTPTFPMATRDAGKQEVQHREDGAFPTLPHKTDHSLQSCCHNNHKKGP